MAIYALGDQAPDIDPSAYVSPEATVIGNVRIGANSSIWPNAVLRGDDNRIEIGDNTSVQDGAVIHCTEEFATIVGNWCTVGHLAHLEGCRVEDHALIGTGSIVLHDAIVRSHALIGAAALVPGRMDVPSRSMALGVPARIRADALAEGDNDENAEKYVSRGRQYASELRRIERT